MIDQATIDRIMDAAQIVDVVSEFVTLRRRGVNYVGLCPFHNEKTPSFSVSPSKGICRCFSCGKGGNVVHFIMEHEQLSYYEALKWLAHKYGIEVKERELTNEEKQAQSARESMFVVNQFACEYFEDILANHVDGRAIGLAYFRSRGFRDDIIKKFHLGYCLSQKDAFCKEALKKGYQKEFLLKTGLCYTKDDGSLVDRFWGRVIFPFLSLSGKIVGFGGRVLDSQTKGVKMKYVNSPESDVYKKSNELYGIFLAKQAIVRQDNCFLVEGYTDVISMHQSGIENVVASSGTALTPGQIKMIHRFTNNITVLYDGDMAGIHASIRGIDMLLEEGMNIKVVLLPDGDDPDSFARKHDAREYQEYITAHEMDFIRFKTGLLLNDVGTDPIKRAGLVQEIVKSISVIPDAIIREEYIRECSQMLETPELTLRHEIGKMKEKQSLIKPAAKDVPPPQEIDMPTAPPPTEENMPPAEYESVIPQETQETYPFFEKEELIMSIIVRYGEIKIGMSEKEDKMISVVEFIVEDLKADEIQFHSPLHRQIITEAAKHIHEEGFSCQKFFLAFPDPKISELTARLCTDRYQLSKYHSRTQVILSEEERLPEIVPHFLLDFKYAIINEELKQTIKAIQKAQFEEKDPSKCDKMMAHYQAVSKIRNKIAKPLGDRPLQWI